MSSGLYPTGFTGGKGRILVAMEEGIYTLVSNPTYYSANLVTDGV
jgi:hypothetical protein